MRISISVSRFSVDALLRVFFATTFTATTSLLSPCRVKVRNQNSTFTVFTWKTVESVKQSVNQRSYGELKWSGAD